MKDKDKIIILLILVLFVAFYAIHQTQKLKKKHIITSGTIIKCSTGLKGQIGTWFDFKYNVNDDEFIGSSLYREFYFKDCAQHLKGKSFPIVYSPDDKTNSAILLTPKEFKSYDMEFPDSLKWLLQYIDSVR